MKQTYSESNYFCDFFFHVEQNKIESIYWV